MKKKIVWLGLSFLLVVALVLASCGGTAPVEEEEEEEEETGELVILSIGETYRSVENRIAITVSEVIFVDSYEYQDYTTGNILTAEAKPDMTFFILTTALEYVGTSGIAHSFEGRVRFRLHDAEDTRYRFEYYLDAEEALGTIRTFSPGESMDGKVLFQIPKDATGLVLSGWTLEVPQTKLVEWPIE